MTYYTMIVRVPGQLWGPEFGDKDLETVKEEMVEQKEQLRFGHWPKGTQFKIIKTAGTQKAISSKVEIENLKI